MKIINQLSLVKVFIIAALFFIGAAVYQLYSSNKAHLNEIALDKHYKNAHRDIENIISDHRTSSVTLALALAKNQEVQGLLCEICDDSEKTRLPDFENLIDELRLHTEAGQLWIQVIDNKGVSRFRSWTDRVGDSLRKVRYDVRQMISGNTILTGMSVGRFSLTHKAMVPVQDKNKKLIGMLEVITHSDAFTEHLRRSHGSRSVILVDERFEKQLTRSKIKKAIGAFKVANNNATESDLNLLKQLGKDRFTEHEPIRIVDDTVMVQYLIQDSLGQLVGYWFTFEDKELVDTTEIRLFTKQFTFASMTVIFLILTLSWIAFLQVKTSAGRRYYQNIINSTSEMIIISNEDRLLEANKRFFEFFSKFRSVDDFLQEYRCICDTFAVDEGLLAPQIKGKNWRDYVLDNPEKEHIAKIMKQNREHYFQVKVAVVEESPKRLFSIVLHDVTRQVRYQKELERKADVESLSGALSRTTFNRILKQETARSLRYKKPLCIAIIDIEGLQKINELQTFEYDDKVLLKIGRMIKSQLREADSFSRISAEEFAILMTETNLQEARSALLRIQQAFNKLLEEPAYDLAVYMGLADLKNWETQEIFVKKADNALQEAKRLANGELVIADDIPVIEKS